MVQQYGAQQRGVCVMRTTDLTQPDSWRAWDGTGFNVAFANPYASQIDPLQHIRQPVSVGNIGLMKLEPHLSTYLNKFVLVGISDTEFANDTTQPGIYYSTSSNLIDWTRRS